MTSLKPNDESPLFSFKVNGFEFEVKTETLTALEILQLSAEKGAIPGKPEEYTLQGDKGKYAPTDTVNLQEDNIFITIPNTPTQVA